MNTPLKKPAGVSGTTPNVRRDGRGPRTSGGGTAGYNSFAAKIPAYRGRVTEDRRKRWDGREKDHKSTSSTHREVINDRRVETDRLPEACSRVNLVSIATERPFEE